MILYFFDSTEVMAIYGLSLETVSLYASNITNNKCIGKEYSNISDAIRAAHKYARRYLGDDYLFIHRKITTVNHGESVILASVCDGDLIRKIMLDVNHDE